MSKERLREAVQDLYLWLPMDKLPSEVAESLGIVIAAARAYACERCGGKGFVWVGSNGEIVKGLSDYFMPCPDCAEWRRIADGTESG